MRSPRMTAALLVLALAGSIAACGDDDDAGGGGGGGGAGGQLTKAEYIEQADDICQDYQDRTEALEDPEGADDLVPYLEEALAIFVDAESRFQELDPPADGEELYDAHVEVLGEVRQLLSDARDLAEDGDTDGAVALLDESDPGADLTEQMEEYGFEACGK